MENQQTELTKKRKPMIALLFSLLSPGLGHVYVGKLKKGFILNLILCATYLILVFFGLLLTLKGLIISLIVLNLLNVLVIIDSIIATKNKGSYKLKHYNRWYFYLLIYMLLWCISFASAKITETTFKNYRNSSSQMSNTLLEGDYIFSNKKYYNKHEIHRDDLIIYKFFTAEKHIVDRVIGLPGDKIEIIDKILYLNDIIYKQPFTKFIDTRIIPRDYGRIYWANKFLGSRDNFGPVTVPSKQYFVLGDNRDISADSRYNGFVHKDSIIAKPVYILFSYGTNPIDNLKEYSINNLNRIKRIRWSRIGNAIE